VAVLDKKNERIPTYPTSVFISVHKLWCSFLGKALINFKDDFSGDSIILYRSKNRFELKN